MVIATTKDILFLDSRASEHIVNNPNHFSSLGQADEEYISLPNGNHYFIQGQGTVCVSCIGESFDQVLCVTDLDHNLMSVSCLDNEGYGVIFPKSTGKIIKNKECVYKV